jgi:anaerobic selenocysteine-containing dehydrogenase
VLFDLALAVDAHGGGRQDRPLRWLMRAVRRLGPRRVLDLLLRFGPHRLSLRKLAAQPHGVDLGPLEPRLPELLATPRKRIALAPAPFVDDVPRLETALAAADGAATDDRLLLIGRRQLRSNNSWMHNSRRLTKGPEACTLLMHPDDARARGLSDGDRVEVRSRVGAVAVPVALSSDIAVGVVSLPHGWGHGRDGVVLRVAKERAGASINDLTDEERLDALSGNAGFSGLPVTVAAAG